MIIGHMVSVILMWKVGAMEGSLRLTVYVADIISAILPEDMLQEFPQGFTQVGHVCMFPYQ